MNTVPSGAHAARPINDPAGPVRLPAVLLRAIPRRAVRVAALALLLAPAPSQPQTFTKITAGPPVTETGAWRSVNWVDYDRDGDLDLFVTRGLAGGQDNVLFRNDGGPGFAFTRMGNLIISQDHRSSDGSTWADYDNDGFPDAFVANWYNQNNLLYHNDGNGAFTRITAGPAANDGGYSETASWGDYDNDGLADLYVANSSGGRLNFLYRNTGGGTFAKVTTGRQSTDVGTSRGVNWVDYDDDGDLDLFVANESDENDFLYRNMRLESGVDTFQRVTTGPLVTSGGSSWSGSWADYDNDGDQDLFVANHGFQPGRLFVNQGGGAFAADTAGPIATDFGYGASGGWGDIDNDGDLDLVVTHAYTSGPATVNFLYRNLLAETDTARFERVLNGPVVTDAGFQYGSAWGDYDGDGDLDLFVARTYGENQVNAFYANDGNANRWLTVDLRGTASNAAAIGAKVRVKATMGGAPAWQLRVVEGQAGYCGQNLQLHFGLRDAASADSLVVEWPSGAVETFTGVAAGRHLVVVENDSTPSAPVSPAQGALNDSPEVRLTWTRSLHYPPYRLQVSTDPGFAGGMVADTLVGDSTATVRVVSTGDRYYWRVAADRAVRGLTWSAVRYFDNDVQLPGAVSPVAPAQGAVNVPLSTQIRWTSASRSTGYRLRLSADTTFASTLIDTVVADTSFAAAGLPYLTTFAWDATGVSFVGQGPPSPKRTFTTIIEAPALPSLSSPADGETNTAVPATLRWLAAARAASYRVQISPESLFVPPFSRDTVVSDTSVTFGWPAPFTKYFWRVRSINDGGQSAYTGFRDFRTVVAAPAPALPPDGSSQFADVRFTWSASPPATHYRLQYGTDSTFAAVAVDDSVITDTSIAAVLQPELRWHWRVKALHPESESPWSAPRSFVTTPDTFVVRSVSAWTLVSLPGNVPDRSAATLFPGALSPFYRYAGVYETAETLDYGAGYWVRMAPGSAVAIAGTKRFADTIVVAAGWNLVGPVSAPVAAGSVAAIPPGLPASPFFGYDGGFRRVDTLLPGRGYWIRTAGPGQLLVGTSIPPPAGQAAGRSASIHDESLPPPPPGEAPAPAADPGLPALAALLPNYPNPFNPSTEIRFEIPSAGEVRIELFDVLGSRVETLVSGHRDAGRHSVTWNAADLPSGPYYARMTAGSHTGVIRMLLVR